MVEVIANLQRHLRPYSKSKLELKSNLNKFCQLNASLFPWFYHNLIWQNFWNLALSAKKKIKIQTKIYCITQVPTFSSAQVCF